MIFFFDFARIPGLVLLSAFGAWADNESNFELPPGLVCETWAESPQLFNPTAMDVDERGRLWVTEAVNYRKWGGRNPGREHEEGDRVLVLEDTDGDGRCDRSTVFAQGPELVSPLGICVLGEGRVLVSCSPTAWLYIDEDGDDVADRREVFLTGFGGPNHDHGLHSFTPGPDGKLYTAVGNAGPHLVTDRDGWTLRSGSVYVGGGEHIADNKPGLVSDDGRVWVGGLVLRVDPDGSGLEVMAHNFRNPYEVAVDSYGDMFTADNDDDGNRSCRTTWVMEGGNYGYFSADGSRFWQADRRPGQSIQRAHWHQDDPGVMPAGTINGAGGPTGVCVYEGGLLDEWVGGAVLNADAGAGVVYAHRPRLEGAGIALDPGWLVRGREGSEEKGARWFRPSDVCVGLDGSVFVADWYDPGVGGHLAGDREAYGRILRIAPKGAQNKGEPIALDTPEGALRAFRSPAPSVRAMGAKRLFDGGEEEAELVRRTLESEEDPLLKARLISGLATSAPDLMSPYFEAEDPRLCSSAVRAWRRAQPKEPAPVLRLSAHDSPLVRREVLTGLGAQFGELDGLSTCDPLNALLHLLGGYDGEDRYYLEAIGVAADESDPVSQMISLVIGRFEGGERGVLLQAPHLLGDIAWRLHGSEVLEDCAAIAQDDAISLHERRQALETLAFIPNLEAAKATLDIALRDDGEIGQYAAWWVKHRSTNLWRDYDVGRELAAGDFSSAELAWESEVLRSGFVEAHVDLEGAERIWLVVDDGGDGNSCDWADWIRPRFLSPEGETKLTDLAWVSAESSWGVTSTETNAGGGPMRVKLKDVPYGIGTHAKSVIEYRVPPGTTAFETLVGPDDGGTGQNGGQTTSVQFRVYVERARDRSLILSAEALLFDDAAPMASREAAAVTLAQDPEGGLILIRRTRDGELPEELRVAVQMTIFLNPDIAVRALASEVFPRPGEEANALPPVAELLAMEGDPARGRRLYRGETALCSTCHVYDGLGREIGPDLTEVRKKLDRPALLDAILNPSAGIAFGYESWLLEVEGEGYMTGFLLADGEVVELKDSAGLHHIFAREEVLTRQPHATSLMPQGVALGLGPQGIADLVAMLAEDPGGAPVLGEPIALFDGTSLDAWSAWSSDAEATLEDVWTIEDGGVLRCAGQPIGYLQTKELFQDFVLELEWRFDPEAGPGNSGVLLRKTGPDEIWPRSIEAQLHHRNAGDIWNIGEVPMLTDPARTNGRRTTKLLPSNEKPLGEWNHYRITLDRGELELEVNGEVQNRARWCDEVAGTIGLQSEGAVIEFRRIMLRPIVGHE